MTAASKSQTGKILLMVGRIALAIVFLVASYAKLRPQTPGPWSVSSLKTSLLLFAMQVDSYQLVPEHYVAPAANLLPFTEFVLGLLLVSGWQLRWVATATAALLGFFFSVMVRTYAAGLEINCGCFGPGEKLGPVTLIRDGSLLALALAVTIGAFILHRRSKQRAPMSAALPEGAK